MEEPVRRGARPGRTRLPGAARFRAVALAAMAAGVGAAAGGSPVYAQAPAGTLERRVVSAAHGGDPVEGALVWALSPPGARVARTLTGPDGTFRLERLSPATYRLEIERIGFATTTTDAFDVAAGATVRRVFLVASRPVDLEGVEVTASARCTVDPRTGESTARLWDEARKALEAARWTSDAGLVRYDVSVYERLLDPTTLSVLDQSEETRELLAHVPYRSLPAARLAEDGYLRVASDGSAVLFAPDAGVVLSETFLTSHCFERTGDDDGAEVVGLAFRPVGRPGHTEVEGVLWLDRESLELERLDFRYVELPWRGVRSSRIGGSVEFDRLDGGPWIVRRWSVTGPVVDGGGRAALAGGRVASRRGGDFRIAAFAETGAEVRAADVPLDDGLAAPGAAELRGIVWDSVAGEALSGATVRLLGVGLEARSDGEGRFSMEVPWAGRYRLDFDHPRLDSLPVDTLPTVPVEAVRGRSTGVHLAIPAASTLAALRCAPLAPGAAVAGRVTDGRGVPAMAGVEVLAAWTGTDGESTRRVRTGPGGWFAVCGLPRGGSVALHAEVGDAAGPVDTLAIPDGAGGVTHDLVLGTGLLAALETAGEPSEVQRAVLGRVVDAGTGRPLSGVAVRLTDLGRGPVREAVSDAEGGFHLPAPRPDRYRISATALGFDTVRGVVRVESGRAARVEIRLGARPIDLRPLEVVVESRSSRLERVGYYEREERTSAWFIDAAEIERRVPTQVMDVFRGVPRVRIVGDRFGRAIYFEQSDRDFTATPCFPQVVLDGATVHRGGVGNPTYLDRLPVRPEGVVGIEIYQRPSQTPVGWSGPSGRCGTIVIWTR